MAQHIVVLPYDLSWKQIFQKEKELINDILKDNCLAIYHIGSTSVPFLDAKPIIDIMVVCRNLAYVDDKKKDFNNLEYEYLGEFGIKGRRYLRKGGDERTHQIHIFQVDDLDNIIRHLAFKEYLKEHEKERDEYAKLKNL